MPTPDQVNQLVDLGGFVLFLTFIIVAAVGLIRNPPWWVPGSVYRREIERGDRADTQAERTADALEKLVAELYDDRER